MYSKLKSGDCTILIFQPIRDPDLLFQDWPQDEIYPVLCHCRGFIFTPIRNFRIGLLPDCSLGYGLPLESVHQDIQLQVTLFQNSIEYRL